MVGAGKATNPLQPIMQSAPIPQGAALHKAKMTSCGDEQEAAMSSTSDVANGAVE